MFNRPPRLASVLIVEDDLSPGQSLESLLRSAGFETRRASAHGQWLFMVESVRPDAILLKLGLQDCGGLQICRGVREATNVPILLLAGQTELRDVIQGLEAGADAHVLMPCNPELILASVHALLRRCRLDKVAEDRVIEIRDLRLDLNRCEAVLRGHRLALTPTEFRLLWSLAANAGRVVSCSQLLEMAQGYRCAEQEAQEIVKVHVGHLRSKLPVQADETQYILTVRGFGYMLERRVSERVGQPTSSVGDDGIQEDTYLRPDLPLRSFRRTRRPGTLTEEVKPPTSTAPACKAI